MAKKKKTITPEEPKLFEKFWNEYAMKLDRIAAVRAWNSLDEDSRRAAIDGIQHYSDICEALGVRRMWPQGYLNHRRWEDEGEALVSSDKFQDSKPETCSLKPEARDSDLPDMAIW